MSPGGVTHPRRQAKVEATVLADPPEAGNQVEVTRSEEEGKEEGDAATEAGDPKEGEERGEEEDEGEQTERVQSARPVSGRQMRQMRSARIRALAQGEENVDPDRWAYEMKEKEF